VQQLIGFAINKEHSLNGSLATSTEEKQV
jgi:hypothetical protein